MLMKLLRILFSIDESSTDYWMISDIVDMWKQDLHLEGFFKHGWDV